MYLAYPKAMQRGAETRSEGHGGVQTHRGSQGEAKQPVIDG